MTMKDVNRRDLLKGAAAAATLASASVQPASAAPNTTLRVAMSATNVYSLDPRRSVQNADQFSSRQIYDALLDPPDGTFDLDYDKVLNELAESWEVSPDGKTWTVKLREGVQFHKDNGEVTSDDVKFTYDQMLDPKFGSTQRVYLSDLDSVEIVDKYRVKFQLKQPNPTFHASGLISLIGSVVSRKAAEKVPAEVFARNPVGCGPYEFASIDADRGVVLKAFDKYHGGRPSIDTIEIRYMADPTARTLALLKGDLDIIEGARLPGWVDQLKQQKPDVVIDQTRPGSINTFFFNMGKKPFDDIRVRKALRYGIDREVIIKAFGGVASPSWGINPPEFPGGFKENELPEELRYDYDPKKAKALLAEAGLGKGLKFEIIMTQREDYASIMLMVQDMWREVGVDMKINTIDHTTYHAQKAKDVNAVVLQSSTFAPVSTQIPVAYYRSGAVVKPDGTGSDNYSHYGVIGGPGVDDLIEKALNEPNLDKRQGIIRQAELKILADMPSFTICTLSFIYARNPRLNLGFDVKAGYARYRLSKATFVA
jgi:peptide/nickel transport system substrate-binding protein